MNKKFKKMLTYLYYEFAFAQHLDLSQDKIPQAIKEYLFFRKSATGNMDYHMFFDLTKDYSIEHPIKVDEYFPYTNILRNSIAFIKNYWKQQDLEILDDKTKQLIEPDMWIYHERGNSNGYLNQPFPISLIPYIIQFKLQEKISDIPYNYSLFYNSIGLPLFEIKENNTLIPYYGGIKRFWNMITMISNGVNINSQWTHLQNLYFILLFYRYMITRKTNTDITEIIKLSKKDIRFIKEELKNYSPKAMLIDDKTINKEQATMMTISALDVIIEKDINKTEKSKKYLDNSLYRGRYFFSLNNIGLPFKNLLNHWGKDYIIWNEKEDKKALYKNIQKEIQTLTYLDKYKDVEDYFLQFVEKYDKHIMEEYNRVTEESRELSEYIYYNINSILAENSKEQVR